MLTQKELETALGILERLKALREQKVIAEKAVHFHVTFALGGGDYHEAFGNALESSASITLPGDSSDPGEFNHVLKNRINNLLRHQINVIEATLKDLGVSTETDG